MKKNLLFFIATVSLVCQLVQAQKKPLHHQVYDSWQSVGEKLISNDGSIVVYSIVVQEGDSKLYIQKTNGDTLAIIDRGYTASLSSDNNWVFCKIKPTYKQLRDARIAKKKADDLPKDSLAIFNISNKKLEKIARVKSYKIPEKGSQWMAYLLEKNLPETKTKAEPDSITKLTTWQKMADSLLLVADSLKQQVKLVQAQGLQSIKPAQKTADKKTSKEDEVEEGTNLVIRFLQQPTEKTISLTQEYYFSKNGNQLVIETTKKNNSSITSLVLAAQVTDAQTNLTSEKTDIKFDTIAKAFTDAKQFVWGNQEQKLAFLASYDTSKKEQKHYALHLAEKSASSTATETSWKTVTIDSILNANNKYRIQEHGALSFSLSDANLLLYVNAKLPAKDTSLPEFERVNVDVWHYQEDELMTVQLKNIEQNLKRGFLSVYNTNNGYIQPIADSLLEVVLPTQEADGNFWYALAEKPYKVQLQWEGSKVYDVYSMNKQTTERKLIYKNLRGYIYPSYQGNFVVIYDEKLKKYFSYHAPSQKLQPIACDIKYPLYDEENDLPDYPNAYGVAKWTENDKAILLYDRYDMWKVDPLGKQASVCLTNGRINKNQYRYMSLNEDEKFISDTSSVYCKVYNEKNKTTQIQLLTNVAKATTKLNPKLIFNDLPNTNVYAKAKNKNTVLCTAESFTQSPNVYVVDANSQYKQLSNTNTQQSQFNWGTASLFTWKAYTGKMAEGVLYKPEGFDSTKKYPMIVYYYERNNHTLHQYIAPAPTPSRLNISYFVSNGFVVFVPDIWYSTGQPGKSAYDYIVSGTRALIAKGFIDSTKLGLQGQSWGGYQTAYLITQTNLFKAAWAGAPVANMFSAYGGIRWESGLNRQFQYEHQQSRIGATIWQRPDLYIKNSPLFHLPKVNTPLVIMANDADGAVPWYQGIELFTALRRLGKPCWMLNYNGEAHNLMDRKNRKDIQIREQQFFDWLLKQAPAPAWIKEGVPAIMKGRTLGL